jgi:hypothetical protein
MKSRRIKEERKRKKKKKTKKKNAINIVESAARLL